MAADRPAPDDDLIRLMLGETRAVAVVGASVKPHRPSFFVSDYLRRQGYRVLPVNPGYAGRTLHGEPVRPGLAALAPLVPDMVAIFRRSEHAGAVADEAAALGVRFVWMQVGIRDDAAAERVRARGGLVVMGRCLMVEHARLARDGVLPSPRRPSPS
jgi:predicted CoA-binding protein